MCMNQINISVIMPVYNSGKYLKTAVESILQQSFKQFELILVDDGSTDGSAEQCDWYAQLDSRVVVIHQKNGGICNARNTALKIARGEYVAFSDHDDEYLPGLLENTFQRAKQDDADFVKFCKREFVMSDGVIIRKLDTKMEDITLKCDELAESYLALLNEKVLDCVWDCFIRREILLTNNLFFDESYKAGSEDIDFITRLLPYVKVMSLMNNCYYLHYIRTGFSTSAKYNPIKLSEIRLLAERITEGCKSLGIDLWNSRAAYMYQMTFTLLNGTVSLLSNSNCEMSKSEKLTYLNMVRNVTFLPEWFFSQSPFLIFHISKRYALSYFFFKHKMYRALFCMTSLRDNELQFVKYLKRFLPIS